MWIYEGHMGSLYASEMLFSHEDLYCEQCGDHDWLIGYAINREDAWELLKDNTDTFDASMCKGCPHDKDYDYCNYECEDYIMHSGGWNYEYVKEFIETNWEK